MIKHININKVLWISFKLYSRFTKQIADMGNSKKN